MIAGDQTMGNSLMISMVLTIMPRIKVQWTQYNTEVSNRHQQENHWWCTEHFHMTSREPCWCPRTMERLPGWSPKSISQALKCFLVQIISLVPIH